MRPIVFLLSALLFGLLAPTASADRIRLTTGEVVIGKVTRADFQGLSVEARFPKAGTRTFSPDETDPVSFYEALAPRLDPDDSAVRLKLAEFCLKRGVFGYAIVEAQRAAALDSAVAAAAKKIEQSATDALAEGLLEEAKTLLAVDRISEARLYFNAVIKRYGKSSSAPEARRLLRSVPRKDPAQLPPPVTRKQDKDFARKKLKKARKLLANSPVAGHYTQSSKNEQKLKRAAAYAERAYELVAHVAARGTDEDMLTQELRETAAEARSRLAQASLALGSLFLSRGAITAAESMCQKACAIEPENKAIHKLHGRILDARMRQRFSGY